MIDWHCHILPAIDDGSPDMEHSLNMAASLSSVGFTTVYCTPHLMRGSYEASNDQVRNGVAELQERLAEFKVPLNLLPGREYYLDEFLPALLEDPLTLGASRQILVEIPPGISGEMVRELLYSVVRKGFTPVIAHPERSPLLEPALRHSGRQSLLDRIKGLTGICDSAGHGVGMADTSGNPVLDYLRELGCSFQGNLGSFNGFYGARTKVVAEELRRLGVYDRYGSDLHSPEHARQILRVAIPG